MRCFVQEGFVTIDRRKGAVISIDADKVRALEEMKQKSESSNGSGMHVKM